MYYNILKYLKQIFIEVIEENYEYIVQILKFCGIINLEWKKWINHGFYKVIPNDKWNSFELFILFR